MEELEREEFFRLKKVQEVKKKRAKKPQAEKKKMKTTCPVCLIEEQKQRQPSVCIICSESVIENKLAAGEKTPDIRTSLLMDLKEQLDLILSLTREYERRGMESDSITEFKKIAEDLKDKISKPLALAKIPDDVNTKNLCGECKTRFEEAKADKVSEKAASIKKEHDIVPPMICCKQFSQQAQETDQDSVENITSGEYSVSDKAPDTKASEASTLCEKHSKASSVGVELGVFETTYKTKTKIIRRRGLDGNIVEERKVIRIKKELKNPSLAASQAASSQSSKTMYQLSSISNDSDSLDCYGICQTCGVVTICIPERRRFDIIPRNVQSYYTNQPLNMADPKLRNCISSGSMVSVISYEEICANSFNVSTSSTNTKNDLEEHITCDIEIKKIMEYFEPMNYELTVTSMSSEISIYQSALTSSKQTLVSKPSFYDKKKRKGKSKSDQNVNKCVSNFKRNMSLQSLDSFNTKLLQKFLVELESSKSNNS